MSRVVEGLLIAALALFIASGLIFAARHPFNIQPEPKQVLQREFSLDKWATDKTHDSQYKLTCWRHENGYEEGYDFVCIPDALLNYQPKK